MDTLEWHQSFLSPWHDLHGYSLAHWMAVTVGSVSVYLYLATKSHDHRTTTNTVKQNVPAWEERCLRRHVCCLINENNLELTAEKQTDASILSCQYWASKNTSVGIDTIYIIWIALTCWRTRDRWKDYFSLCSKISRSGSFKCFTFVLFGCYILAKVPAVLRSALTFCLRP